MLGLGLDLDSGDGPSGPVLWTPLNLGSKLVGWLSADDHGTANMVDDGAGLISSWTDRVSTAAFTPSIPPGSRPTWGATAWDATHAGVNVTTDDAMFVAPIPGTGGTPAAGGAWASGSSNAEIWAVLDQKSLPADTTSRVYWGYGNAAATSIQMRRIVSASVNRNQLLLQTGITDGVTDFSGKHIVAGVVYNSGTTGEAWSDGALRATGTVATQATATTKAVLGANIATTPTTFAEACYRHLFVISGTLTTVASGEKDKLFGWCAWDSGLTSLLAGGHPYKLAPPTV